MPEVKNEVSSAVVGAVSPVNEVKDVNLNEFKGVVPLKNIEYLGRCYDFIRLNPLDLGERLRNGGGCMPTFAVDIPPEKCDVKSPDQSVLIPQGTKYRSESRGEKSSRVQIWTSAQDLSASFKSTVTGGLEIPGVFSFSGSSCYQDIYQSTSFKKHTVTFVQSYFEFCGIELKDDFHTKLRLNPRFVEAVKNLTSAKACRGFIQIFGTHYAREVIFGGRMYQRIHVTEEGQKYLKENNKDLAASAEGTYKKATISLGGSSSSSSSSALESKQGISVEDLKWVGGTPSTNFDEWVKSIRDDPKPMQLDLEPLHSLFTEEHFPGINIQQRKQWMEKAVKSYISGESEAESEPAGPDLSHLADKEYYLLNQRGAASNDPSVGLQLGILYWDVKLRSEKEERFPWKLTLVPGKTDEFNIQVRWANKGNFESRLDNMLGFYTTKSLTVHDLKMPFPWKLVPVPGKTDEYHLRCATDAKGVEHLGAGVGFDEKQFLKLYPEGEIDKLVPWKLVPVTP